MPPPPAPSSSPPPGFQPRKEFIKDPSQVTAPNTFSLLTLSGQNCIRLYSFPEPTVLTFRKYLTHAKLLTSYREDIPGNFCELALEGKPWASAKSVQSERLVVEVMALVLQAGYAYLSTIDYGREHDDRVAIAFSRPSSPPSSRPNSPPMAGGSFSSQSSSGVRLPFALSFPSSSLLRVIAPPLDSTPAILQAVRGAWPRGVVSEKKVGDNAYEFKLKGYSWFQEDTFATDSLRHILTLLTRLDAHAFSLLTSLSLTNRSRVKDLWIFTGPPTGGNDSRFSFSDSPLSSTPDVRHLPVPPTQHIPADPFAPSHRRNASEPVTPSNVGVGPGMPTPPPVHPAVASHHHRAQTSIDKQNRGPPPPPPVVTEEKSNTLRKPAPRAQVPVSVHEDGEGGETAESPSMPRLPSHISEGLENMTGVGAGAYGHGHTAVDEPPSAASPDVLYASSPFPNHPHPHAGGPQPQSRQPPAIQIVPTDATEDDDTPKEDLRLRERWRAQPPAEVELPSRPAYKIIALNADSSESSVLGGGGPETPETPKEILGANVFRDSGLSGTDTETSTEVPIKWTGTTSAHSHGEDDDDQPEPRTPALPGAWAPTPAEEKPQPELDVRRVKGEIGEMGMDMPFYEREHSDRQIHDVRVAQPELVQHQSEGARKSQAALVGVMGGTPSPERQASPVPPVPMPPHAGVPAAPAPGEPQSPGWVMVNVEGQQPGQPAASTSSPLAATTTTKDAPTLAPATAAASPPAPTGDLPSSPGSDTSLPSSPSASSARLDSASGKQKQPSRMRRLFSLTRKDSKRTVLPNSAPGTAASFSDVGPPPATTGGKRLSPVAGKLTRH